MHAKRANLLNWGIREIPSGGESCNLEPRLSAGDEKVGFRVFWPVSIFGGRNRQALVGSMDAVNQGKCLQSWCSPRSSKPLGLKLTLGPVGSIPMHFRFCFSHRFASLRFWKQNGRFFSGFCTFFTAHLRHPAIHCVWLLCRNLCCLCVVFCVVPNGAFKMFISCLEVVLSRDLRTVANPLANDMGGK